MGVEELTWSAAFDELAVGQRFSSPCKRIGEDEVLAFCALTGDWHPQHWDLRWAASSLFGERIAHGMLVLSVAVGLVPLDPRRVKALRRVGDAVFKRPVRLGEQISLAGEITSLRRVDADDGLVDLRWTISNAEKQIVCRAAVQLLWGGGPLPPTPRAGSQDGYWGVALPSPSSDSDAAGFVPLPL